MNSLGDNNDSPEKYTDMMYLILAYDNAGHHLQSITLAPALRNHLKTATDIGNSMYDRITQFRPNPN